MLETLLTTQAAGLERLASLAKRGHTYCEDGWYSCPKAEDGCADENRGPECDCGADEHNAEVDALMTLLRSNVSLERADAGTPVAVRSK